MGWRFHPKSLAQKRIQDQIQRRSGQYSAKKLRRIASICLASHCVIVGTGQTTTRGFHDAVLQDGNMPVVMVRALLADQPPTKDAPPQWCFYDTPPAGEERIAGPTP